uniref:LOW QUALITY PROTEIN: TRPM8 channel-associated factor homolog n=1 Tax=Geotrypetes seraphini TaxID=260995 RepID=A0A6P8R0I5_GEOSA|nr:LOW QUALITY PROTEIN: TRPM8 channel-associated factor homolog [Geotrypetes seraphini]
MKPLDAYKVLVKGITELDFTGKHVPCDLLLTGDKSFPVLVNPSHQILISASQYGKGRIVVISNEEYLNSPTFSLFLQNAIGWLKRSPEALVGIQERFKFLEEILSSNGTHTRSNAKFLDTFGVYCMDAYNDDQAEELVMFMRKGGGLLIAGQAWGWAQQNKSTTDILSFPGNKITSVAGIHFTFSSADTGVFPISKEIPPIPLMVKHGIDTTKDLKILLDGVTSFNQKTDRCPSALFVHGPLAFSIAMDGSYQSLLAAARYGKGRVVVASHEGQLSCRKFRKFILNAVSWLSTGKQGKIGVEPSFKGFYNILIQEKIECKPTELVPNLSVYCCMSYSAHEAEKIHEFVAEGGGLLIGGHAWWWVSENRGKNSITDYPGNIILNKFGISISGRTMDEANVKPLHHADESTHYHFQKALSHLQQHIGKEGQPGSKLSSWIGVLSKDCRDLLKLPDQEFHAFSSLRKLLLQMVSGSRTPTVGKANPVLKNSMEGFLLSLGSEIYNNCPCDQEPASPKLQMKHVPALPNLHSTILHINCTNTGPFIWKSTGLYVSPNTTAVMTFHPSVAEKGLEVQIGCHSDDLSDAQKFIRAPVVIRRFPVKQDKMVISNMWGGLLYIIVHTNCKLGKITITVEGAVQAPYFVHGKTSQSDWLKTIRHYPAPWAELVTESIIFTIPSESVRSLENPVTLLSFWDKVLRAINKLAATSTPFQRKERVVADVQISTGSLHSGYPIMCLFDFIIDIVDLEHIKKNGTWGVIHELGHNQQKYGWEFPPHTVEATCNLWSIYVHEEVLEIPRDKAHGNLHPEKRVKRIKEYVKNGRKLIEWNIWTCLETYLQLQECFGWKPFIHLFSAYQKITNIKNNNHDKMNLWAKLFSEQVKMNLAPFFQAWGWPIEDKVSQKLSLFPEWEENPMKKYMPAQLCTGKIKHDTETCSKK